MEPGLAQYWTSRQGGSRLREATHSFQYSARHCNTTCRGIVPRRWIRPYSDESPSNKWCVNMMD